MIPRRIPVFLLASGLVLLIVFCASLACTQLLSALGDVAGAAGMNRATIAAGALLAANLVGLMLLLGYLMLEHWETFGGGHGPDGIESPE